MSLKQFKPPPPQKHPEMSDEEWQDHLQELKAFERRNFRQSGGLAAPPPRLVGTRTTWCFT